MSWAKMVRKAMRRGTRYRFTEVVKRVQAIAEKEYPGTYSFQNVKGSVAYTLGNGIKGNGFSRPERGIYVREE